MPIDTDVRLSVVCRPRHHAFRYWKSLYEERCLDFERALTEQRCRTGSYKAWFRRASKQWDEARDEVKRIRAAANNPLAFEDEVKRLQAMSAEVGVDTRKRSTIMSLRMEIVRVKAEVKDLKAELGKRDTEVQDLQTRNTELENKVEELVCSILNLQSRIILTC